MLHTGLTSDKWETFSIDKQILMIANEMNRAKNWIEKQDFEKVSHSYERAFELIDLTVIYIFKIAQLLSKKFWIKIATKDILCS